jgi:hypothetical protein
VIPHNDRVSFIVGSVFATGHGENVQFRNFGFTLQGNIELAHTGGAVKQLCKFECDKVFQIVFHWYFVRKRFAPPITAIDLVIRCIGNCNRGINSVGTGVGPAVPLIPVVFYTTGRDKWSTFPCIQCPSIRIHLADGAIVIIVHFLIARDSSLTVPRHSVSLFPWRVHVREVVPFTLELDNGMMVLRPALSTRQSAFPLKRTVWR